MCNHRYSCGDYGLHSPHWQVIHCRMCGDRGTIPRKEGRCGLGHPSRMGVNGRRCGCASPRQGLVSASNISSVAFILFMLPLMSSSSPIADLAAFAVVFFHWRIQPHLDQMQQVPVRDPAGHRHYPGGLTGCIHRSLRQSYQPSPELRPGRHPQPPFRDLLNVNDPLPPACSQSHPWVTPCFEGFGRFVTSTTAPMATGLSDPLPGGSISH